MRKWSTLLLVNMDKSESEGRVLDVVANAAAKEDGLLTDKGNVSGAKEKRRPKEIRNEKRKKKQQKTRVGACTDGATHNRSC